MESYKYLIIGGGVAGTSAAETLRQKDNEGSIAIISDEPRFYSRIMLSKPNFFLEKIPFDSIWLRQQEWYKENKIDFLEGLLAVELDCQAKSVKLSNGHIVKYEKLLLATGGEARPWGLPGATKQGICYIRDLDEAKTLIENVKTAKESIAVGSGFVSFEMCEMMRLGGLDVTLVMREPYYWYPIFDEKSSRIIEEAMTQGGVKIIRNSQVSEILGNDRIEGVILENGTKVNCQLAVIGIGLLCNLEWIKKAGVEVDKGILTNEFLETSAPDIYAAGDVAEFHDLVLGEQIQLGNWVNAQVQGRVAANNMLASSHITGVERQSFRMVSFYTCIGFGLNIAMSGDVRVKPGYKVIERGSLENKSLTRLIVDHKNEIIGATFINRTQELAQVNKLIEADFKVDNHETELADPNFDIKQLNYAK